MPQAPRNILRLRRAPTARSRRLNADVRRNVRFAATAFVCFGLGAVLAASEPQFPLTSGEYEFQVADAEFDGKFSYAARVSIQGVYIKVVITDCGGPLRCNEVFADGTIWWHELSGQWIIAESQEDYAAEEVGGCSAGPMTIDPTQKVIWYC